MIFKELIDQLKKVKTPKDANQELALEMISAGISTHMMSLLENDEELHPLDGVEITRSMILSLFDEIMLEMNLENMIANNELPS